MAHAVAKWGELEASGDGSDIGARVDIRMGIETKPVQVQRIGKNYKKTDAQKDILRSGHGFGNAGPVQAVRTGPRWTRPPRCLACMHPLLTYFAAR